MAIRKNVFWNYKEERYFPDNTFPQRTYELASLGITHADPQYHISRLEGVTFYVFEYIISGRGTLRVEDQVFYPQAGDVYIMHPDVAIEYWSDPNDPWVKIWFNIYGELPQKLIEMYNLSNCVLFKQCPLQRDFQQALDIIRQNQSNAGLEFALSLHRICAKLSDHHHNISFERKDKAALRIRDFLHEHYSKNIRLADLAQLIQRTPEQTLRIFKKEFGITPMHYLQELRLKFAKQYLLNTNYTLRTIAEQLGFQREYYFAAWFKKCTGLAPGHFRRQL